MKVHEATEAAYKNGYAKGYAVGKGEANIPQKVVAVVTAESIKVGNGWWGKGTTIYRCPKCNTTIMRYCKFCYECGQALDWGKDNGK